MKFIKCEVCGKEIAETDKCELARYQRTIDGEQYTFCCVRCSDKLDVKQKEGKEDSSAGC